MVLMAPRKEETRDSAGAQRQLHSPIGDNYIAPSAQCLGCWSLLSSGYFLGDRSF